MAVILNCKLWKMEFFVNSMYRHGNEFYAVVCVHFFPRWVADGFYIVEAKHKLRNASAED